MSSGKLHHNCSEKHESAFVSGEAFEAKSCFTLKQMEAAAADTFVNA